MRHEDEILNAGGELARGRLALYSRLAELVMEQEAALEREDLEDFDELTRLVAALRERLGTGPASEESWGGEGEGVLDGGVPQDEAARLLRVTLARSERIHDRLAALRGELGGEIRRVQTGRKPGRRYLEASGSAPGSGTRTVDVKF